MTFEIRDATLADMKVMGCDYEPPKGSQVLIHETDGPVMIAGTTVVDVGLHAYSYLHPRLFRKYAKTCTRYAKIYLDSVDTSKVAVFMLALPHNAPWAERLGFSTVSDAVPIGDHVYHLMQLRK